MRTHHCGPFKFVYIYIDSPPDPIPDRGGRHALTGTHSFGSRANLFNSTDKNRPQTPQPLGKGTRQRFPPCYSERGSPGGHRRTSNAPRPPAPRNRFRQEVTLCRPVREAIPRHPSSRHPGRRPVAGPLVRLPVVLRGGICRQALHAQRTRSIRPGDSVPLGMPHVQYDAGAGTRVPPSEHDLGKRGQHRQRIAGTGR
jgi:hypothetical protein